MVNLKAAHRDKPGVAGHRLETRAPSRRPRGRGTHPARLGAACALIVLLGGGCRTVDEPTPPASAQHVGASSTSSGAIPPDLDLADGLARDMDLTDTFPGVTICGASYMPGPSAVVTAGVHQRDKSDLLVRGVIVYRNAAAAAAAADGLVTALQHCRNSRGPGAGTVRAVPYGDEGWAYVPEARGLGDRRLLVESIYVVRSEAVVLVVQQREVHGIPPRLLADWVRRQVEILMGRQVCVLTGSGCPWRSDPDVLRPDGWGPLQLGMSRAQVEAAGGARFARAGDCTSVDLQAGLGLLSPAGKLVSLQVPAGVSTTDGIGVGSTRAAVLRRYLVPDPPRRGMMLVRASPTADYEITVDRDRVTQLALAMVNNECSAQGPAAGRR